VTVAATYLSSAAQHCGVDFFGGRISRGFVENGRQRIETDFETREGSLRH
jgi:hypothetical protein